MGDGGARWRIPQLTEKIAMQLMDYHRADVHGQQIGGGGEEVRDGGGDEAVHDAGWSGQGSYHNEMPHPVLRGGCSQEEFKSFKQHWNQYAKYHNGMDVGELRQQLLNCADGHTLPDRLVQAARGARCGGGGEGCEADGGA